MTDSETFGRERPTDTPDTPHRHMDAFVLRWLRRLRSPAVRRARLFRLGPVPAGNSEQRALCLRGTANSLIACDRAARMDASYAPRPTDKLASSRLRALRVRACT